MNAIIKLASAIITIVTSMIFFRPYLFANGPNTNPPIGLETNPTAKTAKVLSKAEVGSALSKRAEAI
ncbi:hypothetical protein D3C80_1151370 [compost metagenome]